MASLSSLLAIFAHFLSFSRRFASCAALHHAVTHAVNIELHTRTQRVFDEKVAVLYSHQQRRKHEREKKMQHDDDDEHDDDSKSVRDDSVLARRVRRCHRRLLPLVLISLSISL